jgi:hypothetical protein
VRWSITKAARYINSLYSSLLLRSLRRRGGSGNWIGMCQRRGPSKASTPHTPNSRPPQKKKDIPADDRLKKNSHTETQYGQRVREKELLAYFPSPCCRLFTIRLYVKSCVVTLTSQAAIQLGSILS